MSNPIFMGFEFQVTNNPNPTFVRFEFQVMSNPNPLWVLKLNYSLLFKDLGSS